MKFIILPALLFGGIALGQTPKPSVPTVPVTPPVLTDAQKLAYFKASGEYQSASFQVQQMQQGVQVKKVTLDKAVKDISDACGQKFQPTIDANGDPACVAKPEPPKTEPVKPAEAKK